MAAAAETAEFYALTEASEASARAVADASSRLALAAKIAADAANQETLRSHRAVAKNAARLVRAADLRVRRSEAKAAAKSSKQQRESAARGAAAVMVEQPAAVTAPIVTETAFESPRMV